MLKKNNRYENLNDYYDTALNFLSNTTGNKIIKLKTSYLTTFVVKFKNKRRSLARTRRRGANVPRGKLRKLAFYCYSLKHASVNVPKFRFYVIKVITTCYNLPCLNILYLSKCC